MANKFQVKRTTVSGRTPNTTSSGNSRFIDTGELALNLPDGKMFSSNGSVYFEVGANLINSNITGNLTVNAIIANGSIGTAGQQLVSNGSSVYWSSNASTTSVSSNTVSANIVSANNLTINEGISVGNTSVNTSINSTAIFSGNTTSNSLVSPTVITAANTLSNSTINPSTIFVGNSLTNAIVSINQVDTTVSGITSVQLGIQSNPGWIAVFMPGGNTNLPSAATTDYYGSSYVKIANTHPWLNDVNWSYNPVVSNSTCIGYFWDPSLLGNVLKIKSFVRTSGNVVVETVAAHGANTSTFPSGFTAKFVNITALPNGLANTNGVHTLNVVNTTAFWYTVPSAPYKNLTVSNLMFPNGYYGYTGTSASPIMQSTLLTATATAGYFVYFIETSSAHGISNGTSVVVSGITNTPTKVGTVSYQWNGTYKAWTSAPGANSTYFAVLVAAKAAKGAVPSAQTGPVAATGTTPVVQQNINISYTPAVPCFIGPIDTTLSPTGPGASLKQTDPVVLQVANTNTRVRVTPRNIFVGNTSGGTYTIIDQYKITAAKRGSFLSSSVSGDGIRVESLIDDLTPAEANSSFFFANATVMQVGNSTVGSIITSNLISTQEISLANTDDSRSNVSLTSQSVSINTTDSDATYTTTIGSKAATFGGSVQVSSALVLDSTLLANGDPGVAGYVLTSANTSNVYWSSLSGYQTTSGLSANVATLTANNTSFVGSVSAANVVSNAQLSANLTSYQTTSGLSANVATLTANNANNLGGVAAASYVNTSGAYTISGIHTHTANVVVNGAIIAAGSSGSAGQVLTSNGSSNVYWSTITTAGGTVNYAQNAAPSLSVNSTSAVTLAQLTITTSGYPIHVMASGDANPLNAGGWGRIQLFRGTTAIGAQTHFEASAANENVPYCLQYIDTPGNGTYTYALKSTYVTGNTQFGETDGPVITAVELQTIQGGVNTAQQYTWSNTHIFNNQTRQAFSPLAGGANVYFIQQNDDNFVFYTSNTSNQPRAVWSIYANSVSSNLNFSAPVNFSGNVGLGSVSVAANGAYGSAGQVLTSNGSATYWSTVSSGGGGGNITFSATPPVSPTVGNDWIDTDTGIRYTYTYDGDSYQWVEFGTSSLSSGSSDPAIHPFMLAGM